MRRLEPQSRHPELVCYSSSSELLPPSTTKRKKKREYAFTLAEVLITLGIIGVVAAMTMPSLITSHREKQTVTSVKKQYSVLSNALLSAVNEYGDAPDWPRNAGESNNFVFMNIFSKYLLNNNASCNLSDDCFDKTYKLLSGSNWSTIKGRPQMFLTDGTLISIHSDADYSGWIGVDINGKSNPNQWGKDFFGFRYYSKDGKYNLMPMGNVDISAWNEENVENIKETFDGGCRDKSTQTGFGCTAWIIANENTDYLKCSDLSWTGKTKCGN